MILIGVEWKSIQVEFEGLDSIVPPCQEPGGENPVIMPGSKVGIIQVPDTAEEDPVVLPSSKSLRIMPGSKSITPLFRVWEGKDESIEP